MVVNPVMRIYGRVKIIKAKGSTQEDGVSLFPYDIAISNSTKCNQCQMRGNENVILNISLQSSILCFQTVPSGMAPSEWYQLLYCRAPLLGTSRHPKCLEKSSSSPTQLMGKLRHGGETCVRSLSIQAARTNRLNTKCPDEFKFHVNNTYNFSIRIFHSFQGMLRLKGVYVLFEIQIHLGSLYFYLLNLRSRSQPQADSKDI